MNINSAIQWFQDRKGKVTYSMDHRLGPNSYDCSSSVYLALKQGGYFPGNLYVGNTESEFNDLVKYGWTQIQPNAQGNFDTQRGDVFIWGVKGSSSGASGHTGMFTDADNIIHCSSGYNGIAVSNYDWLRSINGSPVQTFYRYTGKTTPDPVPNNPTDQVVEIGSYIKFDGTFRVDDVQDIADVWQVRTDALCPVSFEWGDNGIPAAAITEVDGNGDATPDQSLDVGSNYKITGKFIVLDVGESDGRWLAQIDWNGLKFWVDLEHATEVSSSDPGTPVPHLAQTLPGEVVTPPVLPAEPEKPVEPTKPEEPTKPSEPEAPSEPTPVETHTTTLWEDIVEWFNYYIVKLFSNYKRTK